MVSRRAVLAGGLGTSLAAGLGACGSGGSGSSSGSSGGRDGLRVVWWGNTQRTEVTKKVLGMFASSHGVQVAPEPTEWGGYWDKLATQLAANDAPDVVQMDEKYLLEYTRRKALLDLNKAGVDTASLAPGSADLGTVDGTLYAVTAGTIAPVVMANPALFEQAKVDLPDDSTWTWDQLKALGSELTAKLGGNHVGVTDFSGRDAAFRVWIRQHGAETFRDGKLAFGADVVAAWFDLCQKMMAAKATPAASESAEDVGAAVDQRLFSTGRTALAIYSSNQVTAFDAATKRDVALLRLPSLTGKAADAHLAPQASMYWVVTARSRDTEKAAQLVDFLVNDVAAGKVLRTERGVPANTKVLDAITPTLSRSDKKAIAYLDKVKQHPAATPPLTPKGASSFEDVLIRKGQDVLFGRATPAEAAKGFISEISSAIG